MFYHHHISNTASWKSGQRAYSCYTTKFQNIGFYWQWARSRYNLSRPYSKAFDTIPDNPLVIYTQLIFQFKSLISSERTNFPHIFLTILKYTTKHSTFKILTPLIEFTTPLNEINDRFQKVFPPFTILQWAIPFGGGFDVDTSKSSFIILWTLFFKEKKDIVKKTTLEPRTFLWSFRKRNSGAHSITTN